MKLKAILHPTDLSPASANAQRYAGFLARAHDARLVVVRTVMPCEWVTKVSHGATQLEPEAFFAKLKNDLWATVPDEPGLRIERLVLEGEALPTILRAAADCQADLIVMAKEVGLRGLERWLFRSLGERVAQLATCPVLLVGAAGEGLHLPRAAAQPARAAS